MSAATDTRPEVVLVDFSSILHQVFHVSGAEPDPDHTAKTVVARIYALAQGADHLAICMDSGRSFRRDISADYKATRPERNEILIHQGDIARDELAEAGFPIWAVPGFEADDLLAAGCASARALGHPVMIVSGDSDLTQIVSDTAPVVRVKSVQTGTVFDCAAVVEKFGVLPEQMRDWKSLVGDRSDNITGAKSIGAKTAAALLKRYGSLDQLYRDWDEAGPGPMGFTPAVAASLAEFRQRLLVVRALVTLRTDVPIPFDEVLTPRVLPPMASDVADVADVAQTCETALEGMVDDIGYAMADRPAPSPILAPVPAPYSRRVMTPTPAAVLTPVPTVVTSPEAAKVARVSTVVDAEPVSTAVIPYERALDPRNMAEAITLAKDMFLARNFAGASSPQTALATILMGREMGIPAMTALRTIHVIDGRHALSAQAIVGLTLRSGLVEYVDPIEVSDTTVTYAAKRRGRPEVRLTHTIEMARQAGLVKPNSNWTKIPTDMLVSRCSARICRLIAPDVTANVYTPEELTDIKEVSRG